MEKESIKRLEITADKLEIQDVIYKLARGIDRCDENLLTECFHEGATDDHGHFKGTAKEFIEWVIPLLKTMEATQHCICCLLYTSDAADE